MSNSDRDPSPCEEKRKPESADENVEEDGKERRRKRSRSPKMRRRHDSDEETDDRKERRRKRSRSPERKKKRRESEECEHRHREKVIEVKQETPEPSSPPKKKEVDPILTRAGGAYIPPARLRMMMEQQADKKDEQYQRMNWEKLKKKIHGQVNKVNVGNIVQVVRELLQENVIRGKGLLARSIIQAQTFSPSFSHVYAALVSIINSKFPNIGELIIRRLIIQFKRAFKNLNKATCVTVSTFLGHLANQRVVHELLILELLLVLMKDPTDDSIEIAVNLLKVCGQMLSQVTPQGTFAIFEQLRSILENCNDITSRTQYMIEVLFHVRKEKFVSYPSVVEELDLIEEEDQVCHLVHIISEDDKPLDPETGLNVFKYDPNFEENEAQYDEIRREIIGDADDSDEEEDGGEQAPTAEAEDDEAEDTVKPLVSMKIVDMTEAEQAAFRRKVYLTIQSSLDFQEAAHKLIKNIYKPGIEAELCNMIVDCCAQQRSYTPFFGKLAERFCKLRKEFQDSFEKISRDTYHTIHRFDITKLRNMAKLVSHLLSTDAIAWSIFSEVRMTEEDTTSSGRIYIKTIFLELSEVLGLVKLDERLNDPTMKHNFEGLFPKDHPKNSRFAINFFSYIGLSGLTLDLRKHLKKKEKKLKEEAEIKEEAESSSSSSESSSDSSSDSDSDESSSSDSDSSSSSTSSAASSVPSPKRKKSKKIKQEVIESPPRKQIKLEPEDDYEKRSVRRDPRMERRRDDERSERRSRHRDDEKERGERRHRDKENDSRKRSHRDEEDDHERHGRRDKDRRDRQRDDERSRNDDRESRKDREKEDDRRRRH